jgi:hypothetical protein
MFLFYVLSLGLNFFESIPNQHMYFNLSTQEITPFLYRFSNEIQGQNILVKYFSCTLVVNWTMIKKKISHILVFKIYFVNCTT